MKRREPHLSHAEGSLDAETLEVVQSFETLYAELTPSPEAGSEPRVADDLVVEFPDDLAITQGVHPVAVAEAMRAPPPAPADPRAAAVRQVSTARRSKDVSPGTASGGIREGSTTSRRVWGRLLVAAGIALVLGIGVGYIAGKPPKSVPGAKIEVSPEGGARLRFDYDLKRR